MFKKEIKAIKETLLDLFLIIIPIVVSVKYVQELDFRALIMNEPNPLNTEGKILGLLISISILFLGLFIKKYYRKN